MKLLIIILTTILLTITSCDTTDPKPPEVKPPGYQEDIPWPSLADSPWPMNHHDPQSTGRSNYVGPKGGVLVNKIPAHQMQSSIAIGFNSTIYFASTSPGNIHAFTYEGISRWDTLIGYTINTTPLIDKDGRIYICTDYGELLAFSPDGEVLWVFEADEQINSLGMNIGLDGTLYFIDGSGTLFVVNKDGTLKWRYTDDRFSRFTYCAPTFSPDGNTLYIQGWENPSLFSFNIKSQTIKWIFGNKRLLSSPVVDSQGNIYVIPDNYDSTAIYSLNEEGEIRWLFPFSHGGGINPNTEPTIDKEGNIYFGTDTLYSLNHQGELRWKLDLEEYGVFSPLICDAEGTVYIGTALDDIKISAISSKGEKIWDVFVNDERLPGTSPVISENGTLFFPTFRSNNILVIK